MKIKILLLITLLISIQVSSQKKWTLKECVHYALENNITIKQNELTIQLAEKDVAISKGNFLPNLGFNNNHSVSFGLSSGVNGVSSTQDIYTTNFNLDAGGTIFNGFRNLNSYKQAKLGVESSRFDLAKIEADISLNVVNSYLNVLFTKENLSVAMVQAEISKKQIERTQAQFDAGAIPKGDVLNAKSIAANDNQNVVIQENNLNIALLNIAQLLQVSPTNFDVAKIEVDSPSGALLYENADDVYKKALINRPEINKAKLNIKNADLSIALAKGAFLPTITYSGRAGTSYFTVLGEPNIRPLIDANGEIIGVESFGFSKQLDEQLSYVLGVSLNIPIFNGFQTKNNVAKSKIKKEQFKYALESEKLVLQQTIEQAYLDAKSAAKSYEASSISLNAQKEAFKNAQVSYDYGSITQFDFDQVRLRLVNAESSLIRAKYDYVFKTKVLKFYFGESITE